MGFKRVRVEVRAGQVLPKNAMMIVIPHAGQNDYDQKIQMAYLVVIQMEWIVKKLKYEPKLFPYEPTNILEIIVVLVLKPMMMVVILVNNLKLIVLIFLVILTVGIGVFLLPYVSHVYE
jgi:hypothetical protein